MQIPVDEECRGSEVGGGSSRHDAYHEAFAYNNLLKFMANRKPQRAAPLSCSNRRITARTQVRLQGQRGIVGP